MANNLRTHGYGMAGQAIPFCISVVLAMGLPGEGVLLAAEPPEDHAGEVCHRTEAATCPNQQKPNLSSPTRTHGSAEPLQNVAPLKSARTHPFDVTRIKDVDPMWTGAARNLAVDENVNMPQTPNGTLIFSWENVASQNNLGEISVTTGGEPPTFIYAQAHANQPSIWVHNWNANNLSVTNISANKETPIRIEALGPGIPGTVPEPLPIGKSVSLSSGKTAQGNASPQYMQLVMQSNTSELGIIAFIGGPQDPTGNNGYVVQINASANTGPDGPAPPKGYYATTTSNTYTFMFNWGSSLVFVANLSPATAAPVSVTLRKL